MNELESGVEFREMGGNDPEQSISIVQPIAGSTHDDEKETGSVVGLMNGTVVYRAWYVRAAPDRVRGAPKSWPPRGRVLFLHGGTTERGYRGRGIHSAATRWLLANERGPDVAHAMCFVHADNFPARRTVERAGFRLLGAVDE